METIISLIEKQKTGDVQATQEICRRMTPLLKICCQTLLYGI